MFKVIIFTNFGLKQNLKSNDFLRFAVQSNKCQHWLKSRFEVMISLNFPFKIRIFTHFRLKDQSEVTISLHFPFKLTFFSFCQFYHKNEFE